MMRTKIHASALLAAAAVLTGHGEQGSPSQRPWPPGVQEVSNESPALSPAEALKTFYLPPGYSIELVASEPLVQDPVAMDWDPEDNANEFHWGLDNWMHVAAQDIGLRLKNGAFEVRRTLRRGQWGVAEDDAGRIYRNTNESALHVDLVPAAYFARNPNLLRTRGLYERLADDNPELNTVWPVRPTPATNRAYQFGILRADGSLARFTAVCAPVV